MKQPKNIFVIFNDDTIVDIYDDQEAAEIDCKFYNSIPGQADTHFIQPYPLVSQPIHSKNSKERIR